MVEYGEYVKHKIKITDYTTIEYNVVEHKVTKHNIVDNEIIESQVVKYNIAECTMNNDCIGFTMNDMI